MELKDIKAINQRIYELDDKISRESKVIFISTLVFILTKNTDFQNVGESLLSLLILRMKKISQ